MSDKPKNALAELEEDLNEICYDLTVNQGLLLVIKAKRIVAELAKVGYWKSTGRPHFDDAVNAVLKCRAIAEEGAGDGER